MKIAVINRETSGMLRGYLYDIERREPDSDRPTDVRSKLPLLEVHNGFNVYELPNVRALLQVEGTPVEAYIPRSVLSGDVPILSYERVRYQTLRDGVLLEPNDARDGVIEIVDPTKGVPASYALPYLSGINFINPNGPCLCVDHYDYPRNGDPHGNPSLKWSKDSARVPGHYYDPVPSDTYKTVSYGHSQSDNDEHRYTSGNQSYRLFGRWQYNATEQFDEENSRRILNVIRSIGQLNYEMRHMADPYWLTNCVTSQRGVRRRIYIRGDIKGVYAKTVS